MSLSADSSFRPLFPIPWDMICFLLWCYNSMCPVCEAGSLWGWAPVLSVSIVFLESCSLQRAFVCQALSAAEMFGVNPSYTAAPFSSWYRWTWAPKSMRKGQLDCDGPHFKRPKEWVEEGWRAERLHMWVFSSCVHRHTHNPEGLVNISHFSAILMPLLREKETGDFSCGITEKHHKKYLRSSIYMTCAIFQVFWRCLIALCEEQTEI